MASLADIISKERLLLIDFSAEWCGPCKMLAPVLKEVKSKLGDKVTILKLDVDKNPVAAQSYQIQGVPTLILFKAGKQVWRQSGLVPAPALQQLIENHQ
ncbi:MAG: hypothetical protein RLZZ28_2231 [Bacteroidota bacterium]|jgi:thioredoxin 1